MNHAISSLERQKLIVSAIVRNQRISISEVCEQFAVSEATARRDLESLAAQSKVQRVHGGAIALTQAPPESPILQRQEEQSSEKYRLGQAAAALVNEGETVYLGSGTTILETARSLRGRGTLTWEVCCATASCPSSVTSPSKPWRRCGQTRSSSGRAPSAWSTA
jgi:DeoR/GlpR family transcriptional regulator of sugar metabolism